jgi:hypothetical protein
MSRNDPASLAQLNYLHALYSFEAMHRLLASMKLQTVNDLTREQATMLINMKEHGNEF